MKKITVEEVERVTKGKLKVCPFCGEIPEAEPYHGGGPRKTCIQCFNDECPTMPGVARESPEEAIAQWNTRAKERS